MELTEKRESLQPGLAAVFFVDNAMDICDDRGAVGNCQGYVHTAVLADPR